MVIKQLERDLLTNPVLTEYPVTAQLSKVTALRIKDATITCPPVKSLEFSDVTELRVDGEHDAYFPRERISFTGENRPIKAISTEKYPQILVVRGRVQPVYHVNDMTVRVPERVGDGILTETNIHVLDPTTFRHWAEYISPEEQALSDRKAQLVGLAKISKVLSISPDVTLVFPDGVVDAQSGRQVVEYRGRMSQGNLMTTHSGRRQQLQFPHGVAIDGVFYVEGNGSWQLPADMLSRYGGVVSGRLDYADGRARLTGSVVR